MWISVWLGVAALFTTAHGKRDGAPNDVRTCQSMAPQHGRQQPQKIPPPFDIMPAYPSYVGGQSMEVVIKATAAYRIKGFLIQARRADPSLNQHEPIGTFEVIPGTQETCIHRSGSGSGLTHTGGSPGSDDKAEEIRLTWKAPATSQGHIFFKVTIVHSFTSFWVGEKSVVVEDPTKPPLPTTTAPPKPSSGPPPMTRIDTSDCGIKKGCYRMPPRCVEETCQALVTWNDLDNDYIQFEMSGDTNGWIAVGFSDDKKMGEDSVTECIWNEKDSIVEVRQSWNTEEGKRNEILEPADLGLKYREGSFEDGRVRCRFQRRKTILDVRDIHDITEYNHVLMAWGPATYEGFKEIHVMEPYKYPYVTIDKLSMAENDDVTHTTRYFLVKLHGCLMIIAWMMCASTSIILARYYKLMWPNDRMCGDRIWLAVHRGCNLTCMVCTIVGFVLIFIHVGGYSHMPDLPAKAHPPLGITVTILCILNPLLAACRCSTKNPKRPIFNWIHWFLGTCGFVLASPTLFIGLSLPKAFVPWWATWVMVAFLLFHIIIELLLEIHGCINSRKQKQRQMEFELRKRNDARGELERFEPDPVGHRFKRILLTLYLFVVIVLGLVMIIAIAIG